MRFYLGTHMEGWLGRTDVPLFVSHRRLRRRSRLPRAAGPWALDSGAFSELDQHGRYLMTEAEYAEAVARYGAEVGLMEWAAPMDWMVEPKVLAQTGLTVPEHQERTVGNYLALRETGLPFVPVVQGWTLGDYHRCVDLYLEAGVDLSAEPLVGTGTLCRRQGTAETATIVRELAWRGLRLHGFGVKTSGLRLYREHLVSCDSMAWSYNARRNPHEPTPGHPHRQCQNCLPFALSWREHLMGAQATLAEAA